MRSSAAFAVDARTLGLYVHWPFCRSKCPYCDFNSHVETAIDQRRWRDALVAEIRHFAALTPGRRLQTIFFGGGTPSLMPPETVAAVIETARACWETARDIEITLEANPTSVEAARLSSYRAAGVGRLSLGVQSLDAEGLAALGREHGVDEAIEAIAAAQALFERVSFDLIYARPGQTRQGWRRELGRALEHAGTHLSVYQLTIEPGTVFHGLHRRGELVLPPDDEQAGFFEDTRSMLADAGLPAYEISNHARPGEECRHNLIYWLSADYAGVGPGAHGRIAGEGRTTAFAQRRAPEAWRAAVETAGHATVSETVLEPSERLEEIAMMGLRLTDGIPRFRLAALTGRQPEALFDAAALERLSAGGFLELDDRGLRATPAGRQRLDAMLAALLAPAASLRPAAASR
ncbi:MAG: radical SAM family heme chaperone HemW [Defluviicoccus sp.]|nr:radical SAM family heme chaperone HemW [Defluviicoccus sp.]MDE0382559.1 radical SAM family heme chaperone HemW [Defluviicoccus sp.]